MIQENARHILSLSGGKDSTALAIHLKDKIPNLEYVFCDTQKELPETYEYLSRIEAYLGKKVIRLCSEEEGGRGFDHFMTIYRNYLPSPQMRWCTRELKIKPFEQYIGDSPVYMYIGIRADENREGYISTKSNIMPMYPFKTDGIGKADVIRILNESGIGLPKYYDWRTRSGCYFCFYQRKSEWVGLLENHPDLFKKAMGYEKPDEGFTWTLNESLMELSQPQRVKQIKEEEKKRQERAIARRKPQTLGEIFSGETDDPGENIGCNICHL
jgi:3'-phosphoadenosine 5'-phosphosulfate sulfotransferase (PAPS reductase)/FAD synthetase